MSAVGFRALLRSPESGYSALPRIVSRALSLSLWQPSIDTINLLSRIISNNDARHTSKWILCRLNAKHAHFSLFSGRSCRVSLHAVLVARRALFWIIDFGEMRFLSERLDFRLFRTTTNHRRRGSIDLMGTNALSTKNILTLLFRLKWIRMRERFRLSAFARATERRQSAATPAERSNYFYWKARQRTKGRINFLNWRTKSACSVWRAARTQSR